MSFSEYLTSCSTVKSNCYRISQFVIFMCLTTTKHTSICFCVPWFPQLKKNKIKTLNLSKKPVKPLMKYDRALTIFLVCYFLISNSQNPLLGFDPHESFEFWEPVHSVSWYKVLTSMQVHLIVIQSKEPFQSALSRYRYLRSN